MDTTEIDKKKKIAALTGVLYYLKNEENEKKMQTGLKTHFNTASPWASYNRQSIMQMRSLMQRGTIRRR